MELPQSLFCVTPERQDWLSPDSTWWNTRILFLVDEDHLEQEIFTARCAWPLKKLYVNRVSVKEMATIGWLKDGSIEVFFSRYPVRVVARQVLMY